MAKKLVKRGSEVTSNSDAICKVTGLRHCDDSTKKEIVDYLVKIDKFDFFGETCVQLRLGWQYFNTRFYDVI